MFSSSSHGNSNQPAEVFRKDLISAMKLPDSYQLQPEEYMTMTDNWKPEWEKGVQVPVNPNSIPRAHVKEVRKEEDAGFKLSKKMIKGYGMDEEKEETSEAPEKKDAMCQYDLDEVDVQWLHVVNQTREEIGDEAIDELTMERIIEECDTQCNKNMEHAMQTEEGLGIEYDEDVICDVCRAPDSEEGNEMVFCDKCDICVHQACYGIVNVPEGSWMCRTCALGIQPPCILCGIKGGAMKSTRSGTKWSHVSCALWVPEVSIGCVERMEPITKISQIPASRWALICVICRERTGACIQCSVKTCKTAYHVTCGFASGLEMKTFLDDEADVRFKSYCMKHTKARREMNGLELELGSPEKTHGTPKKEITHGTPKKEMTHGTPKKEMTQEEKANERAKRIQMVTEEFYRFTKMKDIASALGMKDDVETVDLVYEYWKLKRKSGHNKPLVTPTKEVGSLGSNEEYNLTARMKMFVHLRQDLERVRNLCYMVQRREKLSRQFSVLSQNIFRKQCEMQEAGLERFSEEDLEWAIKVGKFAIHLPCTEPIGKERSSLKVNEDKGTDSSDVPESVRKSKKENDPSATEKTGKTLKSESDTEVSEETEIQVRTDSDSVSEQKEENAEETDIEDVEQIVRKTKKEANSAAAEQTVRKTRKEANFDVAEQTRRKTESESDSEVADQVERRTKKQTIPVTGEHSERKTDHDHESDSEVVEKTRRKNKKETKAMVGEQKEGKEKSENESECAERSLRKIKRETDSGVSEQTPRKIKSENECEFAERTTRKAKKVKESDSDLAEHRESVRHENDSDIANLTRRRVRNGNDSGVSERTVRKSKRETNFEDGEQTEGKVNSDSDFEFTEQTLRKAKKDKESASDIFNLTGRKVKSENDCDVAEKTSRKAKKETTSDAAVQRKEKSGSEYELVKPTNRKIKVKDKDSDVAELVERKVKNESDSDVSNLTRRCLRNENVFEVAERILRNTKKETNFDDAVGTRTKKDLDFHMSSESDSEFAERTIIKTKKDKDCDSDVPVTRKVEVEDDLPIAERVRTKKDIDSSAAERSARTVKRERNSEMVDCTTRGVNDSDSDINRGTARKIKENLTYIKERMTRKMKNENLSERIVKRTKKENAPLPEWTSRTLRRRINFVAKHTVTKTSDKRDAIYDFHDSEEEAKDEREKVVDDGEKTSVMMGGQEEAKSSVIMEVQKEEVEDREELNEVVEVGLKDSVEENQRTAEGERMEEEDEELGENELELACEVDDTDDFRHPRNGIKHEVDLQCEADHTDVSLPSLPPSRESSVSSGRCGSTVSGDADESEVADDSDRESLSDSKTSFLRMGSDDEGEAAQEELVQLPIIGASRQRSIGKEESHARISSKAISEMATAVPQEASPLIPELSPNRSDTVSDDSRNKLITDPEIGPSNRPSLKRKISLKAIREAEMQKNGLARKRRRDSYHRKSKYRDRSDSDAESDQPMYSIIRTPTKESPSKISIKIHSPTKISPKKLQLEEEATKIHERVLSLSPARQRSLKNYHIPKKKQLLVKPLSNGPPRKEAPEVDPFEFVDELEESPVHKPETRSRRKLIEDELDSESSCSDRQFETIDKEVSVCIAGRESPFKGGGEENVTPASLTKTTPISAREERLKKRNLGSRIRDAAVRFLNSALQNL